eukprot:TRINITY_DN19761_c0_g3_i1.p1 TRINITY_DN19761_c0_g3~~TRINITY_DN19761_c0_g3_i1.p1  ORF type:complete len:1008 (+),score=216.56 TRINITY_DN19761_c0_g3_i1:343-3024(+)
MENNLISVVCHYVKDVCMDESAVSSDAIIAMLLDGGIVKDWCKRTLCHVTHNLQKIYAGADDQMSTHLSFLSKLSVHLNAVLNVVEVLGESISDSMSPQLIELQQISEVSAKVKQHLEVMAWCGRHSFLKNVPSRYQNISQWRSKFVERKNAVVNRTWPPYLGIFSDNTTESHPSLFIEDALNHIYAEQGEPEDETYGLSCLREEKKVSDINDGFKYPPQTVREAVDTFFLEGSSDLIVAKRAVFLYYLFDRHRDVPDRQWEYIIEDYAGCFAIMRNSVLESLVFCLLDDNLEEATEEACRYLPEIVGPNTHPKIARVLLERQNPDAALMVLRGSGLDCPMELSNFIPHTAGSVTISDAITGVRVRLECGLLTDAYLYQRNHCLQLKEEMLKLERSNIGVDDKEDVVEFRNWLREMEILVSELCELCIRRNIIDRMIELPWHPDEEKVIRKCLLNKYHQDPISLCGNFLVVFYIQRCRYAEAYQVHEGLWDFEKKYLSDSMNDTIVERIQHAYEWRKQLLDKCLSMFPEVERLHLNDGAYSNCLFSSMTEESCSHDMDVEEVTTSIHKCTVEPPGQFPFGKSRNIYPSKLNNFPIGHQQQLSADHKHARHSGVSILLPKVDSPATRDAFVKGYQPDFGRSYTEVQKMRYDIDSVNPAQHTGYSEKHSSENCPSVEAYSIGKGRSVKQSKASSFIFSNIETASDNAFQMMSESKNRKENGFLYSPIDSLGGNQMMHSESPCQTKRLPITSSFEIVTSLTPSEKSATLNRAKLDTPISSFGDTGARGKRPPSDRTWLRGLSDCDNLRRRGEIVTSRSIPERNFKFQSDYSQNGAYERDGQTSDAQITTENGYMRWRSDDGEEVSTKPKSSSRLRDSATAKGRSIHRSRFYPRVIS